MPHRFGWGMCEAWPERILRCLAALGEIVLEAQVILSPEEPIRVRVV